jgi:hypothetical protein
MSISHFSSNNKITEVKIAHRGVDDVGIVEICDALLNNTYLKQINLSTFDAQHNRIGSEGVEAIGKFLKRKKVTVKTLDLSCNTVWSNAMAALGHPTVFASIQILNLNSNHIGDLGVKRLMHGLLPRSSPSAAITLRELYLDHNGIEDAGAQHVSAILSWNTTITIISLNDNFLTDFAADFFRETLATSQVLESLFLEGNRITTAGMELLADGAERHPKLMSLGVMRNPGSVLGFPARIERVISLHRLAYVQSIKAQFALGFHSRAGVHSPILQLLKNFKPSRHSFASRLLLCHKNANSFEMSSHSGQHFCASNVRTLFKIVRESI